MRLEGAGVTAYFNKNRAKWLTAAQRAFTYVEQGFAGEEVRLDDVITPLVTAVEIDKSYRKFRSENHLTQNYWVTDFAAYVLDQTWEEIS